MAEADAAVMSAQRRMFKSGLRATDHPWLNAPFHRWPAFHRAADHALRFARWDLDLPTNRQRSGLRSCGDRVGITCCRQEFASGI
jgi:hypothetical protein